MLRVLTRFFKALALSVVLALSILSLVPSAAQAEPSVSFDTSNAAVDVATIYETNSANQADILADVLKFSQLTLPEASGFLNSSVLKSQDGTKVIALTQWQDLPSFQAYQTKQAQDSTTQRLAAIAASRTLVYELNKTETRDAVPTIHEHEDNVQFSEFRMKRREDQSELLDIIKDAMPGVMQMESGLQWVTLLRSLDNTNIALLAHWYSRKEFEELADTPGYDQQNGYWTSYADNDHHLYEIVKIIR